MTRSRLMWITAFTLGTITIAGAGLSAFGPERIALSEAELQERINPALPRQFHGVTVERATVGLASSQISVRIETRTTVVGKTLTTAAVARGVPLYNAERGEVFFETEDVRLEDSGSGGLVTQLGLGVGGRLGEHIEQNLSRADAAAAVLVARGIKAWLAARPVYRFKDDIKGLVLRASVRDTAIEGNTLVIDVSLIKLTTAVATWLFGLLLVVLVVIWILNRPQRLRMALE
jgi:hypothetical protein